MKARSATSFILPSDKLNSLIHSLQQAGYQVVGPVIVDQTIIYDQITSADDLPQGWTDEQEAGRYRLKRRQDSAFFGFNVGPNSGKNTCNCLADRSGKRIKQPMASRLSRSMLPSPHLHFWAFVAVSYMQ